MKSPFLSYLCAKTNPAQLNPAMRNYSQQPRFYRKSHFIFLRLFTVIHRYLLLFRLFFHACRRQRRAALQNGVSRLIRLNQTTIRRDQAFRPAKAISAETAGICVLAPLQCYVQKLFIFGKIFIPLLSFRFYPCYPCYPWSFPFLVAALPRCVFAFIPSRKPGQIAFNPIQSH